MEFSIFINMHSISITPIRFKSETIFLGACNQWELRALHLMIMKHWLTFCLFPVKQIQIDSQKHYRNNRSFEKSLFFYWISSSLCKETFIQTKNKPTKSIFFCYVPENQYFIPSNWWHFKHHTINTNSNKCEKKLRALNTKLWSSRLLQIQSIKFVKMKKRTHRLMMCLATARLKLFPISAVLRAFICVWAVAFVFDSFLLSVSVFAVLHIIRRVLLRFFTNQPALHRMPR